MKKKKRKRINGEWREKNILNEVAIIVSTVKTEKAASSSSSRSHSSIVERGGKKRKKTKLNQRKFFEKSKIQLKETCKYDVNDNSKF